jgi:hypothetical protein
LNQGHPVSEANTNSSNAVFVLQYTAGSHALMMEMQLVSETADFINAAVSPMNLNKAV